ncbi:MAG: putative transporter, partial [Bacillota bacterium]|nr:putative transporter [Bacillota bacterium]
MKLIEYYSNIMTFLFKLIRVFLAVALVLMVFITSMEVFRRYLFGVSFVWAEELVKFLLVGVTFIGGAAAFRSGGMAYLDLITSRLKGKADKAVKLINNAAIICFSGYLSSQGFQYTFLPMVAAMKSPGLKLNMSVVYITIPIGFML